MPREASALPPPTPPPRRIPLDVLAIVVQCLGSWTTAGTEYSGPVVGLMEQPNPGDRVRVVATDSRAALTDTGRVARTWLLTAAAAAVGLDAVVVAGRLLIRRHDERARQLR